MIRSLKLVSALALSIVMIPGLALASPTPTHSTQRVSAHQRSQPYHDRGTRMHDDRGSTLHH
jgi:hypothetical protein